MTSERVERRLAAIFAADMVGYSRLMEADEVGTIERQKKHRNELIDPKIAEHHGRIVKLMGDGMLVEFASVVDAVRCAVEMQQSMVAREADVPEDRRIRYRVGVNLGDIVIDGDDILGDGVNVAARLEGLAVPGGVCISDVVHQSVAGKIDQAFEDLGEQQIKNIKRPVRAYGLNIHEAEESMVSDGASATATLALPDKPSIAVLSFENMSGDLDQEYFSDGIAEDIITLLSRLHWLFVIARNSSFTYKGRAIDVTEVARDLGVQYVVEGSVRRAGNRVRVNAQLIDATSGNHLWADRYDRELDDIFAIQDEITETILGNIDNELRISERDRARRKPPANLDAWHLYQRGMWHAHKYTKEDTEEAHRLFGEAIEQDPSSALPHAGLAYTSYLGVALVYADSPPNTLAEGLRSGERAVFLDDREAFTHFGLARVAMLLGKHDLAIAELERAIDLNPSYAHAHYALGLAFLWAGRAAEGIPKCNTAIRLSPHDPTMWTFRLAKAWCHYELGNYEDAEHWAREAVRARSQEFWPYSTLAVILVALDRLEEARAAVDEARRLNPNFSISTIERMAQFLDARARERYLEGLRMAGLRG